MLRQLKEELSIITDGLWVYLKYLLHKIKYRRRIRISSTIQSQWSQYRVLPKNPLVFTVDEAAHNRRMATRNRIKRVLRLIKRKGYFR